MYLPNRIPNPETLNKWSVSRQLIAGKDISYYRIINTGAGACPYYESVHIIKSLVQNTNIEIFNRVRYHSG
jgi:hypothetical protein